MSTLGLALHVVRRDLAERRWIVAGWLVVVALATLGAVRGAGFTEGGAMLQFLLPYGALFLAAGLVQVYPPGDAPPGTPVYWRTLPIHLRALLLGKVATATVLLVGVPLAGQLVALMALDTPGPQLAGYLAASAVPLGAVVLGGLLVGSLTRSFGGAAVLVAGLFILVFPLAFARFMLGADLATLPSSPGGAFALYMVMAGLALWMLALRHALDPGSWWTRVGAVSVVLILVGGGQSGLFVTVNETRTWSTVPPQAGESGFPVTLSDLSLIRVRSGPSGSIAATEGIRAGEDPGDEASMQISFRLTRGDDASVPSLVLVHLAVLEDSGGTVLLTRPLSGFTPPPLRRETATGSPETSTYVDFTIPQRHLEGLRSGALTLILHGQGVELEAMEPLELPLEAGARVSRGGVRIVVNEISYAGIAVGWSAFASPALVQATGRQGAGRAESLASSLVEFQLMPPPGEDAGFLSQGSSSGSFGPSGSFDLVLAGPHRRSTTEVLRTPTPPSPTSRLRVHRFEPTRAAAFRMELPPASWDREVR